MFHRLRRLIGGLVVVLVVAATPGTAAAAAPILPDGVRNGTERVFVDVPMLLCHEYDFVEYTLTLAQGGKRNRVTATSSIQVSPTSPCEIGPHFFRLELFGEYRHDTAKATLITEGCNRLDGTRNAECEVLTTTTERVKLIPPPPTYPDIIEPPTWDAAGNLEVAITMLTDFEDCTPAETLTVSLTQRDANRTVTLTVDPRARCEPERLFTFVAEIAGAGFEPGPASVTMNWTDCRENTETGEISCFDGTRSADVRIAPRR